jgi:hypothetical protein
MTQGNESRLTLQRSQNLQQVLGIPSRALAASLDGSVVGDLADQIKGEVADHGHILSSMTGTQARLVLVEGHIEGPVQVVFDAPMTSCTVGKGSSRECAGRDIGSLFCLDFVATLDAALDHGDGGELREAGASG